MTVWDVFFGLFAAACARAFPPIKDVTEYEVDGVLCDRCGDSAWDRRACYPEVCGDCGGQSAYVGQRERCDALRALWLALSDWDESAELVARADELLAWTRALAQRAGPGTGASVRVDFL